MLKNLFESRHFKVDSVFNKILKKIFNTKLVFQKGAFFYKEGIVKPQICTKCKNRLEIVPGTKYYFREDISIESKTESIEHKSVRVSGWRIEYRHSNGNWYGHWNKKIYNTKDQALAAINQTKSSYQAKNGVEFRLTPLYDIDAVYYRDIKIAEIFRKEEEKIPKFYKLNQNYTVNKGQGYEYEKGRIFVDIDGYHCWCLATPTSPRIGSHLSHLIKELKSKGLLDEIDIKKEPWILPHLNREVRELIKSQK